MTTEQAPLFDFPAVDVAAWRKLLDEAGVPFERLQSRADGLVIDPLYVRDEPAAPVRPRRGNACALVYDARDPDAVARAIRRDVAGGLQWAWVRAHASLRSRGGLSNDGRRGTRIRGVDDVARLLEAVGEGTLLLDMGAAASASTALVVAAARRSGIDPNGGRLAMWLDPLGALAEYGVLGCSLERSLGEFADALGFMIESDVRMPCVALSGIAFNDGGADAPDELACVLSDGIAVLRLLETRGIDPVQVLPRVVLGFGVGSHIAVEVAKLRAARVLWNRLVSHAFGPIEVPEPRLVVRTAWRDMTRVDPWVNMLRATVGGFAAIIGGADVIAISPFTEAVGLADDAARRWAINTVHILRDESRLDAVADPAGGSHAIEALTRQLAERAWERVQDIERTGGFVEALCRREIQRFVAASRRARGQALATGLDVSTGTSLYPDLNEPTPPTLADPEPKPIDEPVPLPLVEPDAIGTCARAALEAAEAGASATRLTLRTRVDGAQIERLITERTSSGIEAMRRRSDEHLATHGRRPTVIVVAIGEAKAHGGRVEFAKGMMAVGGFASDVVAPEQAVQQVLGSQAKVAVLCGADDALLDVASWLCPRLRAAGVVRVLVSARPRETETALREAGVDAFAYYSADALSLLKALHTAIEVQR